MNKTPEAHLESIRRLRAERLMNGLCVTCGEPMDRDGWYCKKCLIKYNALKSKSKHQLKDSGKCAICRGATKSNSWMCPDCQKKFNASARLRTKYRKDHGLCVQCGRPSEGYYYCTDCRERKNERYRKIKEGTYSPKKRTGKISESTS